MQTRKKEKWKTIKGFKGLYKVSSKGRIKSLDRNVLYSDGTVRHHKGKILSTKPGSVGYPQVTLSKNGKHIQKLVHHLVAAAFLGPCPINHEICHKNGKRDNCAKSNLYYGTHKQNGQDMIDHGRSGKGEQNRNAALTEKNVKAMRKLFRVGTPVKEVASAFGIALRTAYYVRSNETWAHSA